MNLTLVPTLEKIVLLKLAIRVCNRAEIRPLIQKPPTLTGNCNSPKVQEIISSFKLPESLHEGLVGMIKPIFVEIRSWIFYIRYVHDQVALLLESGCFCFDAIDLQDNLRWQTVGLLDKHMISLDLVRNERLDIAFRFVLACNCCSEKDILELWELLSIDTRNTVSGCRFLPVVKYWTDRLRNAHLHDYAFIPNPSFPYVFQFEYSERYLHAMYTFYGQLSWEEKNYLFGTYGRKLKDMKMRIYEESQALQNQVTLGLVNVDNVAAMRYFLQKFERIKRWKLLELVSRNHFITNELLVFCLSQMSRDQVTELIRSGRGGRVLSCFMNSPWQESFWDFLDNYWNVFEKSQLTELLNYIVSFKIKREWQDFDYAHHSSKLYFRVHQEHENPSN